MIDLKVGEIATVVEGDDVRKLAFKHFNQYYIVFTDLYYNTGLAYRVKDYLAGKVQINREV